MAKQPTSGAGASGGSGGAGGDGGGLPGGCGGLGDCGGLGGGLGGGNTRRGALTESTPAPAIPRTLAARSTAPDDTADVIADETAPLRLLAVAVPLFRSGTVTAVLKLAFGGNTAIADAGRPRSRDTATAKAPVGLLGMLVMVAPMAESEMASGSTSTLMARPVPRAAWLSRRPGLCEEPCGGQ